MNQEKYKRIYEKQSMPNIAYEILKINGKSMHYREITDIMLNNVGYVSSGLTPEASLNSALGRDYRFSKYDGIVELREWYSSNDKNIEIEKYQCPNCGKDIKKDFKYCPYCEFDIEHYCKYCNRELESDWKICPYCGK